MPPADSPFYYRFVDSIVDIGQAAWQSCAGKENPFARFEFLAALETTGCTTRASGWQPHHVVVSHAGSAGPADNAIVAVVPLYLKTNSYGEYVFDWSWANAYQSHGLDYYPKLLTAIPFTPSVGLRVLVAEGIALEEVCAGLVPAIQAEAARLGASSYHLLYPNPAEREAFADTALVERTGTQFHWHNKGYDSFDDFLATLSSRKRKSLKKERRAATEAGFRFRRTEGANITPQQWADFSLFYHRTYLVRGQQGYLSQHFFEQLGASMPEQILLIEALQSEEDAPGETLEGAERAEAESAESAERAESAEKTEKAESTEKVVAAALFFKSATQLFGRYWGSTADQSLLHFETCYYQGQDYCIEHGLKSFDSGAQGEHKIQRGFEPTPTYSLHWLAHPGFAEAVAKFVEEERPHIEAYRRDAASLLPFRRG
jgi:predicted N-acyltransferase